tara:strand:+ start:128 stop:535 length:408 start_codon:yes stop_codon:yes gene_type:complete
MSMLMTSGLMAKVGKYAIPKKEKLRRKEELNVIERARRKRSMKKIRGYHTRIVKFINDVSYYRRFKPHIYTRDINEILKKIPRMKKKMNELVKEYRSGDPHEDNKPPSQRASGAKFPEITNILKKLDELKERTVN